MMPSAKSLSHIINKACGQMDLPSRVTLCEHRRLHAQRLSALCLLSLGEIMVSHTSQKHAKWLTLTRTPCPAGTCPVGKDSREMATAPTRVIYGT